MPDPFAPFQLGPLSLDNRLVLAPMTTYASHPDGRIRADELTYLRQRAADGFGLVMTAACYVHSSGHAFWGQWSCASDDMLESLSSAADAIRDGGSKSALQIHHGGRQCPSAILGHPAWAPSPVPAERPNAETPHEMTEAEILEIIESFGSAAARAKRAGFDAVEIHGANTYLLQQFVSPHSNRRADRWGQDRLLFPLRVIEKVRASVGEDYPVGYRFSPEEIESPGIRWSDTASLIEMLCGQGLAWLHVSLRDFRMSSLNGEFEEPILQRVQRSIAGRIPLIGVGAVKCREDAEDALEHCDLIAVGRAAITDPNFVAKISRREQPHLLVPREGAAEKLTIPQGLADKIYATEGWFPLEPTAESVGS